MLHTADVQIVTEQLKMFLNKHLPAGEKIDLLLSGENGDSRLLTYYTQCEGVFNKQITVARFKHMMGEYPSSSATALWLACYILKEQYLPVHMLKYPSSQKSFSRILIYNNYKGQQHSFILVEKAGL